MSLVALWIEYDGTAYVGWQCQPNGVSIQQLIENALAQVEKREVRVHSSGRTDAGVHARGMVAHFSTEHPLPLSAYLHGVNRLLPGDIAVRAARRVAPEFHARFSASGKWYRYSLFLSPVRSPLHARYAWHLKKPLDLDLMRRAMADFVGEHDFAAFRAVGCSARSTTRRIDSIELVEEGGLLHVDVHGSGFLRHMVRMMVGTLVQIGAGKIAPGEIGRLLVARDGAPGRLTAPAQGLCLMQVDYPPELLDEGEISAEKGEKGLDNKGPTG